LVNGYAQIFLLLSLVIVTLPIRTQQLFQNN